jgi:predicted double-glycine peptidase
MERKDHSWAAILFSFLLLAGCGGGRTYETTQGEMTDVAEDAEELEDDETVRGAYGRRGSSEPNDAQLLSYRRSTGEIVTLNPQALALARDAEVLSENVQETISSNESAFDVPEEKQETISHADIAPAPALRIPLASLEKKASPPPQIEASAVIDNGIKGDTVRVGLVSWRDLPFQTVKHQAYDYSCGSAAVATLMTYVYGMPTSEHAVFREMFARGNKEKIRQDGFSMLDMSNYMNSRGLRAKGYRISLRAIEQHQLPFIALVNNNGYNHFVVVKALSKGVVLVGDPNTGNTAYTIDAFSKMWNGLALVVLSDASRAREAFRNKKEWKFVRARAPIRGGAESGTDPSGLAPTNWQIAPTVKDILPAAMMGTVSTTTGGGS